MDQDVRGIIIIIITIIIIIITIIMQLPEETPAFTGPPEIYKFAGILLDMDGTIVDSTSAIVEHWHKFVFLGRTTRKRCIVNC